MNKPTDEQLQALRIRIAEFCGWQRCRYPETYRAGGRSHPHAMYVCNNNPEHWMHKPGWKGTKDFGPDSSPTAPPDYCADLNAIHHVELILTESQWIEYTRHIDDGPRDPSVSCKHFIHAEAWWKAVCLDRCLSIPPAPETP